MAKFVPSGQLTFRANVMDSLNLTKGHAAEFDELGEDGLLALADAISQGFDRLGQTIDRLLAVGRAVQLEVSLEFACEVLKGCPKVGPVPAYGLVVRFTVPQLLEGAAKRRWRSRVPAREAFGAEPRPHSLLHLTDGLAPRLISHSKKRRPSLVSR